MRSSIRQDERDFEIDTVLGDFSAIDNDLLFLDPGALDIFECFDGTNDALLNGILEARRGTGNDFGNAGDRHGILPGPKNASTTFYYGFFRVVRDDCLTHT
jgi:hypothetical protein